MKRLFLLSLIVICLVIVPFGAGKSRAATGPVFELDPSGGEISSGQTINIKIVNNTGENFKISGAKFEANISPSVDISIDMSSFPTGWVKSPNTKYEDGVLTIEASTTEAKQLAPGEGFVFVSFKATALTDFDVDFAMEKSGIYDEDGKNILGDDQEESWSFRISGAGPAATQQPKPLASTGPAASLAVTFVITLGVVSTCFFVRRAIRAWKLSKTD